MNILQYLPSLHDVPDYTVLYRNQYLATVYLNEMHPYVKFLSFSLSNFFFLE